MLLTRDSCYTTLLHMRVFIVHEYKFLFNYSEVFFKVNYLHTYSTGDRCKKLSVMTCWQEFIHLVDVWFISGVCGGKITCWQVQNNILDGQIFINNYICRKNWPMIRLEVGGLNEWWPSFCVDVLINDFSKFCLDLMKKIQN